MQYTKIIKQVYDNSVAVYRIDNDINGNPRYVIHFLLIALQWDRALEIAKKRIGGKTYRAKWYCGGIVFQSYNLQETLEHLLDLSESATA